MNGRAYGPLLDIGASDLVTLAEFVDQAFGIGLGIERQQEIVGAGHDVVDAGAADLDQQRGGDAVARGETGEDQRLLDVIGVALPRGDAGGLLRGVIQNPAHLLRIQARDAPGRSRGAEVAGDAVRAAVGLHLVGQERRASW